MDCPFTIQLADAWLFMSVLEIQDCHNSQAGSLVPHQHSRYVEKHTWTFDVLSVLRAPFRSARATRAPILPSPGAELACRYDAMTPEGHTNLQQHWPQCLAAPQLFKASGVKVCLSLCLQALTKQVCT